MASLMRWSPFGDLLSLPREVERVFDWTLPRIPLEGETRMLVPTMDVLYRDEDMVVRLELPGMKEPEIEIGVTNDVLTISGEHKEEHVSEHEDYVLKESSTGRFERQVALPKGIDPATIHASITDGVLEVIVPKAKALEGPKTHHIPIGMGGEKH
jgi:HSP20 family protein